MEEGRARAVHIERRAAAVRKPVTACVRRRLVAVERDRFVAAADRFSRAELVVTCELERVEACEHVI